MGILCDSEDARGPSGLFVLNVDNLQDVILIERSCDLEK